MKLRSSLLVAGILTWLFNGNLSSPALVTTAQTSSDSYREEFDGIRSSEVPPQSLYQFIHQLNSGDKDSLAGVYVAGVMSLPVVQQPAGEDAYVSNRPNTLTQFGLASDYGSTGILAHNTLAGAKFSKVKLDQTIYLIYGDGTMTEYVVSEIHKYQALSPVSPFSDFMDLSHPGKIISSTELFETMYQSQEDQVVLQTCIANGAEASWGRLFITARPKSSTYRIG